MPFRGVPSAGPLQGRVSFRFTRSWIDSFIAYERKLTERLRQVQRERWFALQSGRDDLSWSSLQDQVEEELRAAKEAVDTELETGRGRACIVDAIRASPRPARGVIEYSGVEEFVAEDPRRALADWPVRKDAGGADYGYRWRVENPLRRWETTKWRVSWLDHEDSTGEIYAKECREISEGAWSERVWLLGRLPDRSSEGYSILTELELHGQSERNSLAALTNAMLPLEGSETAGGPVRRYPTPCSRLPIR